MADPKPSQPSVSVWIHYLVPLFLWTIGIVLFLRFFDAFRVIFLGVLAAAVSAAALRPLKQVFPGPRWWSAALSALLPAMFVVVFVVLMSWILSEPIHNEIARWPGIKAEINNQLGYWSGRLGIDEPITVEQIAQNLGSYLGSVVVTTTAILTNALLAVVFIFFGSLFLLGEKPGRLISPILTLLPEARRPQLRGALADLDARFRWWLVGTLTAMLVVGIGTGIGYWIVGLKFAIPVAVLAAIAEIVPNFGPIFAFLVALLFAAAQGKGTVIGIIIVYVILQTLESNLLQPFIMKRAVRIPPVVTLFTIILWGKVFGSAGLILAIPINLLIWTFVDHFLLRPAERAQPPEMEDSPKQD